MEKARINSKQQLAEHLYDFLMAYNFSKKLKSLKFLTPYKKILKTWDKNKGLFNTNPYYCLVVNMICFISCCCCYASQDIQGYRGDVLYFIKDPKSIKDVNDSYKFYKDGVLYVKDGKIKDVGYYSTLRSVYNSVKVVDFRDKLIMPGFIDIHVHYPQMEMMGSYGKQLLDWLNNYTFPTEKKYEDFVYARNKAELFLNEMISNGTTSAAIYATTSPNSVNAIFSEALKRNMRIISGKVLMDRNAPKYLLDTPENDYQKSKELINKWHKNNRLLYAVTPRFAVTSSDEELRIAKKLINEFPSVYLQTHLAENINEVALVSTLFPDSKSYLDVYNKFGLVTSKSIFAHAIYLDDDNFKLLHDKGSSIAFCPTSNLFLGSGLFDIKSANKYKVKFGFGSDIGAGTSMSIMNTMLVGYEVEQLQTAPNKNYSELDISTPFQLFYYATLGGAKALNIEKYVGSFKVGNEADFIVLNLTKPTILNQKFKENISLENLLFSIIVLGNNETVEHVYIMGKKVK